MLENKKVKKHQIDLMKSRNEQEMQITLQDINGIFDSF
jgi:hypothetical protein